MWPSRLVAVSWEKSASFSCLLPRLFSGENKGACPACGREEQVEAESVPPLVPNTQRVLVSAKPRATFLH